MLLAILFIVLQIITPSFQTKGVNGDVHNCVSKIISNLNRGSKIIYIGEDDDRNVLKFIHNMNFVTIETLIINTIEKAGNDVYIITDVKESRWKSSIVLILLRSLNIESLKKINYQFQEHRITDVYIVIGTIDPDLFSLFRLHSPCSDNLRIINSTEKCHGANLTHLQLSYTGLSNCRFKAMIFDSPPFTSTAELERRDIERLGVEQYVLEILAKLEQFEVTYISYNDSEELYVVYSNLSVHGPMKLLQEGTVDFVLGAMMLLKQRANAFDYLWGHIALTDEFKIIVKKADVVPYWKIIYLEFDAIVWFLIFLMYVMFVKFILIFLNRDTGEVAVIILDYLFLHGSYLGRVTKTRYIVVLWAIFAYLISTYYQSSLTSIMTNPIRMYQISNEDDLKEYNVKPYFSNYLNTEVAKMNDTGMLKNECKIQLNCLEQVSQSYNYYTIVLNSLFLQSSWRFQDAGNNSHLYAFKQPYSKLIYAIYLKKNFPFVDKLHIQTLRIKESGLVDKYLSDFYKKYEKKSSSRDSKIHKDAVFLWYILGFGYALSILCFIAEIVLYNV